MSALADAQFGLRQVTDDRDEAVASPPQYSYNSWSRGKLGGASQEIDGGAGAAEQQATSLLPMKPVAPVTK
jgi:hypothetical protein